MNNNNYEKKKKKPVYKRRLHDGDDDEDDREGLGEQLLRVCGGRRCRRGRSAESYNCRGLVEETIHHCLTWHRTL